MFSFYTGYYVSPPDDQYLKFKNRCSLMLTFCRQHWGWLARWGSCWPPIRMLTFCRQHWGWLALLATMRKGDGGRMGPPEIIWKFCSSSCCALTKLSESNSNMEDFSKIGIRYWAAVAGWRVGFGQGSGSWRSRLQVRRCEMRGGWTVADRGVVRTCI